MTNKELIQRLNRVVLNLNLNLTPFHKHPKGSTAKELTTGKTKSEKELNMYQTQLPNRLKILTKQRETIDLNRAVYEVLLSEFEVHGLTLNECFIDNPELSVSVNNKVFYYTKQPNKYFFFSVGQESKGHYVFQYKVKNNLDEELITNNLYEVASFIAEKTINGRNI